MHILLAALLLAPLMARAQVELVYKTTAEAQLVIGVQGITPLHLSAGQRVPVSGGGQLEIRPAKAYASLHANTWATYSLCHSPRAADGSSRVTVMYELLVKADEDAQALEGLYFAYEWVVAGKPVRVYAQGAQMGKLISDTIILRPGEEEGIMRVYFFYDGKSIDGLMAREVSPASALADFVALRSAIVAGDQPAVLAWAAQHPKLVVPVRLLGLLAQWDDATALKAVLDQTASRRSLSGRHGGDVLLEAIRANRTESVALLLKYGVKADQVGTNERAPMQQAIAVNSPDIVRQLLQAGAPPNDGYGYDVTALSLAVYQGSGEVVGELLAGGAKWPKSKARLTEWLFKSIDLGCSANAIRLLGQGVDPNAKDDWEPLLISAARSNNMEILDALLKAGAAPNAKKASDGMTALNILAYGGNQAAVERLLTAGASPDLLDKANQSAACAALSGGNQTLARWLLGKYTPAPADLSGMLRIALLTEQMDFVSDLRTRGARLDLADPQIDDVICDAIRRGDLATVKEALAGGYNPNKPLLSDWTVGGVAQRHGQTEILEALKTAAKGNLTVKIPTVLKLPVQVLYRTPSFIPEELQVAGVYGEVQVDTMIDSMGNPVFPRVLPGADPRLARHALKSVLRWLFTPLQDGQIKAWRRVVIPLNYTKGDGNRILYPWELDQPAVKVDLPAESWGFVKTQPVEIAATTFIVNREGQVINPKITSSSSPEIEAQALACVRQWKYRPGLREKNLVWSFQAGFVVMPGGHWIQPKLLFPVGDLPPGAEMPRLLKEGSTKDYSASTDYRAIHHAIALVRFTVGADGKARAVSPVTASKERAMQYAKNMCASAVYEPGKIDGKPVEMEVVRCLAFVDSLSQGALEMLWQDN